MTASSPARPARRVVVGAALVVLLLVPAATVASQVDPTADATSTASLSAAAARQPPVPERPVHVPVDAGAAVAGPVRDVVTPPPAPAPRPAPQAERASRTGLRAPPADAGPSGGSSGTTPQPQPQPPASGAGGGGDVVALVNAERAEAGCGPVSSHAALEAAAQGHSADMAAHDYFSHTSQDGRSFGDRIRAAGYTGGAIGENIAAGQGSASAVMATWMSSAGHRANILNCSFRHIGVGLARGGSYGTYWTQTFGG